MIGFQIKDGFIDIAKIDFTCPYCEKKYFDCDDKYLKRCIKNKSNATRITCECKRKFYVTYDFRGDIVSFI